VITFADALGDRQLNFAEYEQDEQRCQRTTTTKSINQSIKQSNIDHANQSIE